MKKPTAHNIHRAQAIASIINAVKVKGKVALGEIARATGYSYSYVKYRLLPEILAAEKCIKLAKVNHMYYLIYECEG